MIKIVDYGMGNLRSVQKALETLGLEAALTRDPKEILNADRLILPGVGAFGAAMRNLRDLGLIDPIEMFAGSGKPFLGICLGMQLLLSRSEELGDFTGLGIIPGGVLKFRWGTDSGVAAPRLKVPHMGWNTLHKTGDCKLLHGVPESSSVYFVHSYYVDAPKEYVAATATYGIEFCAVIRKENVYATQFHPEKSGEIGLRILENFAAI